MYCCIDEAFDSPLKQQIKMVEKEQQANNNKFALINDIANYQEENNLVPPHEVIPKYNPIEHEKNGYPDSLMQDSEERPVSPSFDSYFTTQGSMFVKGKPRSNTKLMGTPIETIKQNQLSDTTSEKIEDDLDDLSNYPRSNASISSTDLPLSLTPYKDDPPHKEYITRFLREFTGKDSHHTYSHIKDCPHCKSIIAEKLKKIKLFEADSNKEPLPIPPKEHMVVVDNVAPKITKAPETYTIETDKEPNFFQSLVWKGEFKEIMVVLLVGFITIILLDIFVHFNKRH